MYEELTQQRTRIENLEPEIASDFEKIADINGEHAKTNSKGLKYFDRTDLQAALDQYPEIFGWIENPENYFNELTKISKKKKEGMTISLVEFEKYHREVMDAFETILHAVHSQFGDTFSADEHTAFRKAKGRKNFTFLKSNGTLIDRFSMRTNNKDESIAPRKSYFVDRSSKLEQNTEEHLGRL